MAELAVTAIGADQPGIIAAVADVLHERGGNVEDSAMTILGGHFAIMLLVEIDDAPSELADALRAATADMGLTVSVSSAAGGRESADPTHVLSVYGSDHPGIIAGVTRVLADHGANVTDLETRLLSPEDDPIYAMVIEVSVPDDASVEADLEDALDRVCDELDVDHTLRAFATETY